MRLTVNGVTREIEHGEVEHGDEPLVWVLRDELGLTGTHYGCGVGVCGCCTVLVDGEVTRSCQVRADSVADREVVTLEGLATRDADGEVTELHPVQEAFLETPLQCGWCLPGHVLTAVALLDRSLAPDGVRDRRQRDSEPVSLRRLQQHPSSCGSRCELSAAEPAGER